MRNLENLKFDSFEKYKSKIQYSESISKDHPMCNVLYL